MICPATKVQESIAFCVKRAYYGFYSSFRNVPIRRDILLLRVKRTVNSSFYLNYSLMKRSIIHNIHNENKIRLAMSLYFFLLLTEKEKIHSERIKQCVRQCIASNGTSVMLQMKSKQKLERKIIQDMTLLDFFSSICC